MAPGIKISAIQDGNLQAIAWAFDNGDGFLEPGEGGINVKAYKALADNADYEAASWGAGFGSCLVRPRRRRRRGSAERSVPGHWLRRCQLPRLV